MPKKAADNTQYEAKMHLIIALLNQKDPQDAKEYLQDTVKKKENLAQVEELTRELLEAKIPDPQLKVMMGILHLRKGFSANKALEQYQEYKKASERFLEAANQGHAGGQYLYGFCHTDVGISSTLGCYGANSYAWYQKAAAQKHRKAIYQVGYIDAGLHMMIRPPALDIPGGIQKMTESAETYSLAQAQLAYMYTYENNLNIPKDAKKGESLYLTAAEQGHPEAEFFAAQRCYFNKQYKEAFEFYRRSGTKGYALALKTLTETQWPEEHKKLAAETVTKITAYCTEHHIKTLAPYEQWCPELHQDLTIFLREELRQYPFTLEPKKKSEDASKKKGESENTKTLKKSKTKKQKGKLKKGKQKSKSTNKPATPPPPPPESSEVEAQGNESESEDFTLIKVGLDNTTRKVIPALGVKGMSPADMEEIKRQELDKNTKKQDKKSNDAKKKTPPVAAPAPVKAPDKPVTSKAGKNSGTPQTHTPPAAPPVVPTKPEIKTVTPPAPVPTQPAAPENKSASASASQSAASEIKTVTARLPEDYTPRIAKTAIELAIYLRIDKTADSEMKKGFYASLRELEDTKSTEKALVTFLRSNFRSFGPENFSQFAREGEKLTSLNVANPEVSERVHDFYLLLNQCIKFSPDNKPSLRIDLPSLEEWLREYTEKDSALLFEMKNAVVTVKDKIKSGQKLNDHELLGNDDIDLLIDRTLKLDINRKVPDQKKDTYVTQPIDFSVMLHYGLVYQPKYLGAALSEIKTRRKNQQVNTPHVIFIPINLCGGHWALLKIVINDNELNVIYWDSMNGELRSIQKAITDGIRYEHLDEHLALHERWTAYPKATVTINQEMTVYQNNAWACGYRVFWKVVSTVNKQLLPEELRALDFTKNDADPKLRETVFKMLSRILKSQPAAEAKKPAATQPPAAVPEPPPKAPAVAKTAPAAVPPTPEVKTPAADEKKAAPTTVPTTPVLQTIENYFLNCLLAGNYTELNIIINDLKGQPTSQQSFFAIFSLILSCNQDQIIQHRDHLDTIIQSILREITSPEISLLIIHIITKFGINPAQYSGFINDSLQRMTPPQHLPPYQNPISFDHVPAAAPVLTAPDTKSMRPSTTAENILALFQHRDFQSLHHLYYLNYRNSILILRTVICTYKAKALMPDVSHFLEQSILNVNPEEIESIELAIHLISIIEKFYPYKNQYTTLLNQLLKKINDETMLLKVDSYSLCCLLHALTKLNTFLVQQYIQLIKTILKIIPIKDLSDEAVAIFINALPKLPIPLERENELINKLIARVMQLDIQPIFSKIPGMINIMRSLATLYRHLQQRHYLISEETLSKLVNCFQIHFLDNLNPETLSQIYYVFFAISTGVLKLRKPMVDEHALRERISHCHNELIKKGETRFPDFKLGQISSTFTLMRAAYRMHPNNFIIAHLFHGIYFPDEDINIIVCLVENNCFYLLDNKMHLTPARQFIEATALQLFSASPRVIHIPKCAVEDSQDDSYIIARIRGKHWDAIEDCCHAIYRRYLAIAQNADPKDAAPVTATVIKAEVKAVTPAPTAATPVAATVEQKAAAPKPTPAPPPPATQPVAIPGPTAAPKPPPPVAPAAAPPDQLISSTLNQFFKNFLKSVQLIRKTKPISEGAAKLVEKRRQWKTEAKQPNVTSCRMTFFALKKARRCFVAGQPSEAATAFQQVSRHFAKIDFTKMQDTLTHTNKIALIYQLMNYAIECDALIDGQKQLSAIQANLRILIQVCAIFLEERIRDLMIPRSRPRL